MSTKHAQALTDAILARDPEALRAALAQGADPNTRRHGSHPLLLAVMAGSRDNIDELLSRGADPNVTDGAGRAPLHYAAMGAPDADAGIVASLLAAGSDPNARDLRGATPLDLASGAGNEETAKELVRAGAMCRPDRAAWVKRLSPSGQAVGPRGGP